MRSGQLVLSLAALLAMPLRADDGNAAPQQANKTTIIAAADVEAAAIAATPQSEERSEAADEEPRRQQPPSGADEIKSDPAGGDIAGRVESITEAFTEIKNTVDVLNRMKFSGYIQAQYVDDERSSDTTTGAALTANFDQFSIRRARIKFTYQFAPTSRFVLQPDITSSGVVLKDGYVEFTEPWTQWKNTLTAGQFNWPFGFEIMYSSSSREMPERSRVIRTLFPGERDRGVMLSGLGFGERFNYRVAIVNGTGTAQSFDFNSRKDLTGRVGYSFGAVDVGASIYRGAELVSLTGRTAGAQFDKTREGIDFQWATPVTGLGVRGEYIRGVQPPAPGAAVATARANDVEGWYLYAIQNVGVRHQFVVRIDGYDPNSDNDSSVANAETRTLGGSYIFHWDANSKVMFAYEQPKLQHFADPDDNVWTIRYQFSF